MSARIALSVLAGAVVLTGVAAATGSTTIGTPPLEAAYDKCAKNDAEGTLILGDEGHTITIDTGSESGDPMPLLCVLDEVNASTALMGQIEATTSMMGMQEKEVDDYSYTWSYHPDNGIDMTITDA